MPDEQLHGGVAGFEDGDQVCHRSVLRRRFEFTDKDETTGVFSIKDKNAYQFKLRPIEKTPITIGRFSQQGKRLRSGTSMLADPRSAYSTLLDLKPNFIVEFEVEHNFVQDCYSGLACVVRDDRDLPITVHHAMPGTLENPYGRIRRDTPRWCIVF